MNLGMNLTPEQELVFDWLNTSLNLPAYADVYKGALQLLATKQPGYITFVAHAGRDLMNGLAPTTMGSVRRQVDYQNHVDKLQSLWKEEWVGPGLKELQDETGGHLIPYNVCECIRALIDEHKAGRSRSNQAVALFFNRFFEYKTHESIPATFVQEWKSAKDWFLEKTHLRKNAFSYDESAEVESNFRTLDRLLHAAAVGDYARLKAINEILEETNG